MSIIKDKKLFDTTTTDLAKFESFKTLQRQADQLPATAQGYTKTLVVEIQLARTALRKKQRLTP